MRRGELCGWGAYCLICLVVVQRDGVVIADARAHVSFLYLLVQPAAADEQGCAGAEGAEQQELLQELQ